MPLGTGQATGVTHRSMRASPSRWHIRCAAHDTQSPRLDTSSKPRRARGRTPATSCRRDDAPPCSGCLLRPREHPIYFGVDGSPATLGDGEVRDAEGFPGLATADDRAEC